MQVCYLLSSRPSAALSFLLLILCLKHQHFGRWQVLQSFKHSSKLVVPFHRQSNSLTLSLFSVSLISGSVIKSIENIYSDPGEFSKLLAKELPGRGAYFMSLLIVSTCVGTLLELFRAVPLIQSAIRAHIGRRLTEKERSQSVGPFKPLCIVDKIYFSRVQARFLLYFMVLFVYTSISPLVNWFCMIFFLFLGSVYRHQFIFNYPSTPDSGGHIWIMFIATLLACIVLAQLTMWGYLGLKGGKGAQISIALMIPLMVITGLFIIYLAQNCTFCTSIFCQYVLTLSTRLFVGKIPSCTAWIGARSRQC